MFRLGNKVSRGRRPTSTRARLTLEPARLASLCASLRFLSTSEREPQSPAELPPAPALAQVWQVPLGERGTPCAPGGHAGRAASRPRPDRGALGDPSEKRKAGPDGRPRERAHTARTRRAHGAPPARLPTCNRHVLRRANRHVFRRATRASSGAQRRVSRRATGASSGAQPARLATCTRRVFRRATGASCDAYQARLPARNRRGFRRAPSASRGAQPARL